MIIMNDKMVSNLGFLQHNKNSLDTSLQQILNEGFLFMEECFFWELFSLFAMFKSLILLIRQGMNVS